MLNEEVNIFKNAMSSDCSYKVTVGNVLKHIKEGRWKETVELIRISNDNGVRSDLKKSLPAVTFSGCFYDKRLDKNIRKYTGIIVLDIDKIESKKMMSLKKELISDEYCFSFFESPSLGLKCLFQTDVNEELHKEYSFVQVKEYFEMKYEVKVDATGSNLSRLCFVSYDPNLHYDDNKVIFPVIPTLPEDDYVPILKYKRENTGIQNADYSFKMCKSWVEKGGASYVKGHRNIYLYKLCCCLNRAGFSVDDMVYYIHKEHSISKEMRKEVIMCARSAGKNKNEYNTKPIWVKKGNQEILFMGDSPPESNL